MSDRPVIDADTRLSVGKQLSDLRDEIEADLIHYRIATLAHLDQFVNVAARLTNIERRMVRVITLCDALVRELGYDFTEHQGDET